ncbi:protein PFC0760c-like isoform X1 [Neodiprion virginianus]|uniref:protein PFC0760c-like isoform X1 n=1 Tax=Neodiprion virginianus TaxID=2961670 RepID=UPI001EE72DED|nr:protein PFC0760c-like isoform X1 [Neodiprion virginianus]
MSTFNILRTLVSIYAVLLLVQPSDTTVLTRLRLSDNLKDLRNRLRDCERNSFPKMVAPVNVFHSVIGKFRGLVPRSNYGNGISAGKSKGYDAVNKNTNTNEFGRRSYSNVNSNTNSFSLQPNKLYRSEHRGPKIDKSSTTRTKRAIRGTKSELATADETMNKAQTLITTLVGADEVQKVKEIIKILTEAYEDKLNHEALEAIVRAVRSLGKDNDRAGSTGKLERRNYNENTNRNVFRSEKQKQSVRPLPVGVSDSDFNRRLFNQRQAAEHDSNESGSDDHYDDDHSQDHSEGHDDDDHSEEHYDGDHSEDHYDDDHNKDHSEGHDDDDHSEGHYDGDHSEDHSEGHDDDDHSEGHYDGDHSEDHSEGHDDDDHSEGHYDRDHSEDHYDDDHSRDHSESHEDDDHSEGHYDGDHSEDHYDGDHSEDHSEGHDNDDHSKDHSDSHDDDNHSEGHYDGDHSEDHSEGHDDDDHSKDHSEGHDDDDHSEDHYDDDHGKDRSYEGVYSSREHEDHYEEDNEDDDSYKYSTVSREWQKDLTKLRPYGNVNYNKNVNQFGPRRNRDDYDNAPFRRRLITNRQGMDFSKKDTNQIGKSVNINSNQNDFRNWESRRNTNGNENSSGNLSGRDGYDDKDFIKMINTKKDGNFNYNENSNILRRDNSGLMRHRHN